MISRSTLFFVTTVKSLKTSVFTHPSFLHNMNHEYELRTQGIVPRVPGLVRCE